MNLKKLVFVFVTFHLVLRLSALDEIKNARLSGANVMAGSQLTVKDDKFPSPFVAGWTNAFAYMKSKAKVEFGLDETKHRVLSDINVEITFNVIATDALNDKQTFTNQKLKITYRQAGAYKDKVQYNIGNFSKLDISIVSIVVTDQLGQPLFIPLDLYLEAEVATDRHYLFYPNIPPNSGPSNINNDRSLGCGQANNDLLVYWDYVQGAEEYELEWTWVQYYPGNTFEYDFKYDATRVVTKNTFYKIPLMYENGYILYRLRHIGRGGSDFTQRVEGAWTSYPEKGYVSAYPTNLKYTVVGFSLDKFNWSSTITFDENGRKGSGVSFMDGMLMGRQSLAHLNTENKIIAQSVIYDYQGRPAISILPVPLGQPCTKFEYQANLNLNNSGTLYNKKNFDEDQTNLCVSKADPISVNSGASNYYSTANANKEGAQGYLPDAGGYPYVQVEYTPDMTGRIKSQTMPGEAHQLGTGKETQFYYSNPGSSELQELFGSEVGNVKHYDKNIVKDANGQLSASYIDMEGRVIATSLLGVKPPSLDAIEDYNVTTPHIDNLASSNIVDKDKHTITSIKNIFATENEVQDFTYDFMPLDYTDPSCSPYCFDCLYELEIKITDDCQNALIAKTDIVGNISTADNIIGNCDDNPLKFAITPNPLSVTFPNTGNYIVSKTLKVSDINIDKYAELYLVNNNCIETHHQILTDEINKIDASTCYTDCQSCLTSVSSYTNSHGDLTPQQIKKLVDDCQILCIEVSDPCLGTKTQMLHDFYPKGQYAFYKIEYVPNPAGVPTEVYTFPDPTSIFNLDPSTNKLGVNFKSSALVYLDAKGDPSFVKVMRSGVMTSVAPKDLTPQEFIQNYQPSWADAFLHYHPEKCYLDFCNANRASEIYDHGMLEVNTYDEAVLKGYLKPLEKANFPGGSCIGSSTPNYDPFFTITGLGNNRTNSLMNGNINFIDEFGHSIVTPETYVDLMNYALNTFYPIGTPAGITPAAQAANLYNFARALVPGANAQPFGCVECTKDQVWLMFRSLYQGLKMRIVAQRKTDYVIENGCFNGCMQSSGLQPFNGISTSLKFIPYNFSPSPIPASQFYTYSGYAILQVPFVSFTHCWGHNGLLLPLNNYNLVPACSNAAGGAFDNKTARFPQMPFNGADLLAFNSNLIANDPAAGSNSLPGSFTIPPPANVTDNNCANTCASYAEGWIAKLKNCNPLFDPEHPNYDREAWVESRNELMAELINVCKNGCDPKNPYGASTVNPALNPAPVNKSFQDVINAFSIKYPSFIPNPNSADCNALVLNFPEPYGHDYSGSGNQNLLDTCGCNKILKTKTQYIALTGTGGPGLPSGVTNIEQYFEYLWATPISNFNDLACKCFGAIDESWHSNYTWKNGERIKILNYKIPVSEDLACTSCTVTCSMVNTAITAFNDNPNHQGWLSHPNYNSLLASSLNANFNLNLTATDYFDFQKLCRPSVVGCPELTAKMLDLKTFFNSVIKYGYFKKTNSVFSNGFMPPFFNSNLYPKQQEYNHKLVWDWEYNLSTHKVTFSVTEYNKVLYTCSVEANFPTNVAGLIINDISILNSNKTTGIANIVFNTNLGSFNGKYLCAKENCGVVLDEPVNPEFNPIKLCNKSYTPLVLIEDDCLSSMINQAHTNATYKYNSLLTSYIVDFKKKYKDHCIGVQENFERTYYSNEYHYTLYYYDQAGNLTRTVPPKGVHKLTTAQVQQLNAPTPAIIYPKHSYVTNYKYQSYGAPITSNTPDEHVLGVPVNTDYYYDPIGRIQLSQNAKQKNSTKTQYSYTLYDDLGRIKEVGVLGNLQPAVTLAVLQTNIQTNNFETYINNSVNQITKFEVIKTYYDTPLNNSIMTLFGTIGQSNLRNRVATVTFEDQDDYNPNTYTYATHYTYDEHGNVGKLIQDVPTLSQLGKNYTYIDYDYDLISGNVNKVTYQKGLTDQFIHKYEYDEDNRLHNVYTSKDEVNWDRDAKYFYYEHGPLARTELGDQQVQGTDFAYTIHGWLKAVNSNALFENADIGKDGAKTNEYYTNYTNLHRFIATDAAGYSLNYYQQGSLKDYKAIKRNNFNSGTNQNMIASTASIDNSGLFNLATDAPDLYNGNISSMVTSIYDMDLDQNNTHAINTAFPQITAYRYDQLHRITQMKAFRDISLTGNAWNSSASYDGSYFTNFTYDKNGNIKTQRRDGAAFIQGMGLPMDDLTYITEDASATNPTNQLVGLNDAAGGNYTNDIKGTSLTTSGSPSSYDYTYDEIGSLQADRKEYIESIEWTVDRKVKRVIRDGATMSTSNVNLPDLEFEYDANRQRIAKIVKPHQPNGILRHQDNWVYTYYSRDASGNIAATYQLSYVRVVNQANTYKEILTLQEHDIYGSSRLGTIPSNQVIKTRTFTSTMVGDLFGPKTYIVDQSPELCLLSDDNGQPTNIPCPTNTERNLGLKRYELTNHLGNVITVISDRKLAVLSQAIVQQDYSSCSGACGHFTEEAPPNPPTTPMGSIVNVENVAGNNKLHVTTSYRYDGAHFDFTTIPGHTYVLTYEVSAGSTPNMGIYAQIYQRHPNNAGLPGKWASYGVNNQQFTAVGWGYDLKIMKAYSDGIFEDFYIDNVVIEDLNGSTANYISNYAPEILETHDYYAGGMDMPGRNYQSSTPYRYGMNGQEKDDEIANGIYTAEYWEYDSRLGRRWNTDPVVKDYESPYACFFNNPLVFADPSGADGENKNGGCDISQKDANAGNSRVGDTYTDKSGKQFENKGGNEGWQQVMGSSSSSPLNSPSASLSSVTTNITTPKPTTLQNALDIGDKSAGWQGITISLLEATNKIERAQDLLSNGQFEAIINNKVQTVSTNFYTAKATNPTISKDAFNLAKARYAADVSKGLTVLKVVKAAGVVGNVVGVTITIMKISTSEKVEPKDKTSLGMGIVGFVPMGWIPSGAYFMFDFFFPEENAILQGSIEQGMEARRQYSKDPLNAVVCFKAGTLIYTSKGLKPIENVSVEDSVYSVNTKTKAFGLSKVSKTLKRKTSGVYKIEFKTDTVYVTSEHPFYVKNIGWIPVKDLKVNDILINSNKEDVVISNVTKVDESTTVYNLEVEENHNYFITDDKILVHNKKIVDQSKKKKNKQRDK